MKFTLEQRWPATVDQIMAIYTDESFWSNVSTLSATTTPEVRAIERRGDNLIVSLHYSLAVELPREAARFIDLNRVTWVEETTWNLKSHSASIRFLPDQAGRLIRASASSRLLQRGAEVVRSVNGDVRVQIPLLGSRVERVIVSGVEDHLKEESHAVSEHLDEQAQR